MPDLTWSAIIAIAIPLAAALLLAMDERNRRKFQPREDADSSLQRVHRRIDKIADDCRGSVSLLATMDDRVGDLESEARLLAERQMQQWERISEQMSSTARTIEGVTQRLERVSEIQQEQAIRLERIYHQKGRPE